MHHADMKTHRDIIQAAGADTVRQVLDAVVSIHTVRSWQQRDAIPGEYWAALAAGHVATLEDLAIAANARRRSANDTTTQARAA